jgi:hypothetical protein
LNESTLDEIDEFERAAERVIEKEREREGGGQRKVVKGERGGEDERRKGFEEGRRGLSDEGDL